MKDHMLLQYYYFENSIILDRVQTKYLFFILFHLEELTFYTQLIQIFEFRVLSKNMFHKD